MKRQPNRASGILDGIGPQAGGRRGSPADTAVKVCGFSLLAVTAALIVFGPAVMSRTAYISAELFAMVVGVAYGIFLAAHSRSNNEKLERAYSAHLEELSQRLRTMAYRDALTGLYNHRYFYEQLSHEIDRGVRYGQPLAVLLMDMNNFKQVNDTYGHMVGDKFLSLVGQVIARQIRASDIGARYGGDEFVVILPNTGIEEAQATAHKLADAVAGAVAVSPGDEQVALSISVGLAVCPDDSRSASELVEIADSRLYEVKSSRQSGRGQAHRQIA
jgi:diguanylate cyclase (GGDEF)-like protein